MSCVSLAKVSVSRVGCGRSTTSKINTPQVIMVITITIMMTQPVINQYDRSLSKPSQEI